MIRIKLDATNLILVLLAGFIVLFSPVFLPTLKQVALFSAAGLIFVAGLRSMFLGLRRDGDKPQRRRENVPPTKLQQATEQIRLRQAIKLIKSGDKDGGRTILIDIVASNPESEAAWLLLTSVVSPDKRAFCLEKALRIDPNNIEAKQYLEQLKASELNQQP